MKNFNLRSFLTENKLTQNTKQIKEVAKPAMKVSELRALVKELLDETSLKIENKNAYSKEYGELLLQKLKNLGYNIEVFEKINRTIYPEDDAAKHPDADILFYYSGHVHTGSNQAKTAAAKTQGILVKVTLGIRTPYVDGKLNDENLKKIQSQFKDEIVTSAGYEKGGGKNIIRMIGLTDDFESGARDIQHLAAKEVS